jgi:hypothetical protein
MNKQDREQLEALGLCPEDYIDPEAALVWCDALLEGREDSDELEPARARHRVR